MTAPTIIPSTALTGTDNPAYQVSKNVWNAGPFKIHASQSCIIVKTGGAGDMVELALSGSASQYLDGTGAWSTPAGGGGGSSVTGNGRFHVDLNGTNQTGLTAGGFNKAHFNNEVIDASNYYDSATNFRYQPTVAGLYWFYMAAYCTSMGGSNDGVIAVLRKNGSTVAESGYLSFASAILNEGMAFVAFPIALNGSTEYVEAFVYPGQGTTLNGTATASYFGGFQLS